MAKQLRIVQLKRPPRRNWKTIDKGARKREEHPRQTGLPHRRIKFYEALICGPIKTAVISGKCPRGRFIHFCAFSLPSNFFVKSDASSGYQCKVAHWHPQHAITGFTPTHHPPKRLAHPRSPMPPLSALTAPVTKKTAGFGRLHRPRSMAGRKGRAAPPPPSGASGDREIPPPSSSSGPI